MTARRKTRLGRMLKERYRLESLLGVGGMAEVYRARNVLVDRVVAIKILRRELAQRPDAVERFMREAKAAGAVRHRHIVDVLDIDKDDDGVTFIVQEYLEGEDLAARLKRDGKLAPEEALAILLPVAEAVGFAHQQGIVHRDLKPDNVFIAVSEGETVPKVLDFGISKLPLHDELRRTAAGAKAHRLTAVGAAMGTPYYMSPEQIRDPSSVDARTDVWSLGVVLFEAVAGQMPFDADELHELFGMICSGEPHALARLAPAVPAALDRVVHRCLSADPRQRYPDGIALAAALARVRAALATMPAAPRSGRANGPPSVGRASAIATPEGAGADPFALEVARPRGRKHSGRFRTYDPNLDPRSEGTASIPASTSSPAPASDPPGALALPELDLDLDLDRPPPSRPISSRRPREEVDADEALPSGMDWDEDDLGIELEAAPDIAPERAQAGGPAPMAQSPTSAPAGVPSDARVPSAPHAPSRRIRVRSHREGLAPETKWRLVRALLALLLAAVVAGSAGYGTPEGLLAMHVVLGDLAALAALGAAAVMLVGAIWVGVFALRLPAVSLFVGAGALLVTTAGSLTAGAAFAAPGLVPALVRKAALVAWPWAACIALGSLAWFAISYGRDLGRLGERAWSALAYLGAVIAFVPIVWLARLDWPGVADVTELEVGLTPAPAARSAHQLGVIYEGARGLPPPTPLPVDGAASRGAGAIGAH